MWENLHFAPLKHAFSCRKGKQEGCFSLPFAWLKKGTCQRKARFPVILQPNPLESETGIKNVHLLQTTEQRHEERYADVDQYSMQDGQRNGIFTRIAADGCQQDIGRTDSSC